MTAYLFSIPEQIEAELRKSGDMSHLFSVTRDLGSVSEAKEFAKRMANERNVPIRVTSITMDRIFFPDSLSRYSGR